MVLEPKGILTQDADPGGTTLIDAHNGFNKLVRPVMLCMVHNRWLAETRIEFN